MSQPPTQRIVERVLHCLAVPPEFTAPHLRFEYRGFECTAMRVLFNNRAYVGLIRIAQPATPQLLTELTDDMHMGRPFALSTCHDGQHYVGFHCLHACDDPSLPGGTHKSVDYVAHELKAGVNRLVELSSQ